MRNLDHVSDENLFTLLHRTKDGVIRAMDEGTQQAQPFHVGVMMLEIFEKELRKRGFDPSDEVFGRDVIGEIIAIKLEDHAESS